MLTINIVCVGKIKEQYLKDAITEYSKRLSRYCKLHIIEVPDEKIPDKLNNTISEEIKEKECLNISNHLPKDTFPICLDLKGKEFSSEEFSKNIENTLFSNKFHHIYYWRLFRYNSKIEK